MNCYSPRLLVVVGSPGSGKDKLIRAIYDLGRRHAEIVPKHTSRTERRDEGSEMYFPGEAGYDLESCDIKYNNFGDTYGLKSSDIWSGLYRGVSQVLVVSNIDAINNLRTIFGKILMLLYVHSAIDANEFASSEADINNDSNDDYIKNRSEKNNYRSAFDLYCRNISSFDHVLIYADVDEDLYDQIFRLLDAYERCVIC